MSPLNDERARAKASRSRATAESVDLLLKSARLRVDATEKSHVRDRLENMPKTARRGYLKALRGRSMAAAIKAFCFECVGWSRKEVERCTSVACPLYPYRPFKAAPAKPKTLFEASQ